MTDNQVEDLERGPAPGWLPGLRHQQKIGHWTAYLHKQGVPIWKAERYAFKLWKMGQQIDSGKEPTY